MSEPERVRIADLPTLETRPKPNLSKPISRVEQKAAKDKSEDKAWEECKRVVWARDGGKCRSCRRVVVKTIELIPQRGEVHHITRRAKAKSLLTDPRNCLLVCLHPCHEHLTHHELAIIGTANQVFTGEDGKTYLDASCPLTFITKESV